MLLPPRDPPFLHELDEAAEGDNDHDDAGEDKDLIERRFLYVGIPALCHDIAPKDDVSPKIGEQDQEQ